MRLFFFACCALALAGCMERELGPVNPRITRTFLEQIEVGGEVDVDLLLVIDNSQSMAQEQASLRRELPALVRGLTEPPLDDDGQPRWNPVESLRVAVVTTDLGTTGHPVPYNIGTCAQNGFRGDDGALRGHHRWERGDDIDAFVAGVSDSADVGISGCGIEQPMAAAIRAVEGTPDFPREDSLFAVLMLGDEEDCSVADPQRFFAGTDTVGLNPRCAFLPEALMPLGDVLERLRGERPADKFLFASIVGAPVGAVGQSLSAVLEDPAMAYREASTDTGLRAACGEASPGRRFVEFAQLVPGSLVGSICAESYEPVIASLTERIGARLNEVCATRRLEPDANGEVLCRVLETLSPGQRCSDGVARSFYAQDGDREVCEIRQRGAGAGSGWFYDTSGTCEALRFTEDARPVLGSRVNLECVVQEEVVDLLDGGTDGLGR